MKKKGQQAVTFGNTPNILLSFAIMAMIAGASVLAMTGFKDGISQTDGVGGVNTSAANTTLDNGITGLLNFSAQLGTVGTMIGVGLLLLVVIGIFGFMGRRGLGGQGSDL